MVVQCCRECGGKWLLKQYLNSLSKFSFLVNKAINQVKGLLIVGNLYFKSWIDIYEFVRFLVLNLFNVLRFIMKVSIVLVTLFSFVMAKDFCYNKRLCDGEVPDNCNAIYGSISHNRNKLSHFVNSQISRSFQYLLMSSYFGTYVKNRPGFEKLYRKMSDEAWEKGIDLIKHITKRGGIVNFSERSESQDDPTTLSNLSELQSLAVALDSQIVLAEEANEIHKEVSRASDKHDAEIASYLENEFVHEYSESIRHLSGYANDLKGLIVKKASATAQPEKDISLPVYIFDEYLQKVV